MFNAENMELIKKVKKTKITHHFDTYSSGLFFFSQVFICILIGSILYMLFHDLLPPPLLT